MEKAIEKLKEEYNKLCDEYNLIMDNYEDILDISDLATKYRDSTDKQRNNKNGLIADGFVSVLCGIPYFWLIIPNLVNPTASAILGLIALYLLILTILFGGDVIKTLADKSKHKKLSEEFIDACRKKDGDISLTKETSLGYANQLIEERNQYKVETEEILPTIVTLEKILNSYDPVKAMLDFGSDCPIVAEALKEEWNAYLDECAKVKPYEMRTTTDKITPNNYLRVPEAAPKKLLYGSPDRIKLNK